MYAAKANSQDLNNWAKAFNLLVNNRIKSEDQG